MAPSDFIAGSSRTTMALLALLTMLHYRMVMEDGWADFGFRVRVVWEGPKEF